MISEVLLVDGGSTDDTATVADVAGCIFMNVTGSLGQRLKAAAAAARSPWLLFLRPGHHPRCALDRRGEPFQPATGNGPASRLFQRGGTAQSTAQQAWRLLAAALGGGPHPEQGLMISKPFYAELGGHSELAADPETDLLRRIGRRQIVTLSAAAFPSR